METKKKNNKQVLKPNKKYYKFLIFGIIIKDMTLCP